MQVLWYCNLWSLDPIEQGAAYVYAERSSGWKNAILTAPDSPPYDLDSAVARNGNSDLVEAHSGALQWR